jgi:putative PIN family toxin of toxin-antitoxin system
LSNETGNTLITYQNIRNPKRLIIRGQAVTVCRDPKDDKFLEAALSGKADAIVSGDADYLVLNPVENIPVLRPAEFLARI